MKDCKASPESSGRKTVDLKNVGYKNREQVTGALVRLRKHADKTFRLSLHWLTDLINAMII